MLRIFRFIKALYKAYIKDELAGLSAQVAYFLLLSIFPFLLFLMTLITKSPLQDVDILGPLVHILPYDTFKFLKNNLLNLAQRRNLKLFSIGLLGTLWAASNGVGAIIVGLNKAYNVKEKRSFIRIKLVSIVFTLALSFVVILYFTLLVFGKRLGVFFTSLGLSQNLRAIWDIFRFVIPIAMMVIVFACIYRFTPCSRLGWREVLPGAIFTTVGWLVASLAFSYYLDNIWNIELVYGSIGSFIALLIWLYLSATLLLLGGQVNALLAFSQRPEGIRFCK